MDGKKFRVPRKEKENGKYSETVLNAWGRMEMMIEKGKQKERD